MPIKVNKRQLDYRADKVNLKIIKKSRIHTMKHLERTKAEREMGRAHGGFQLLHVDSAI